MTLYPVIMAGGSGTRLWPLSREQHPKQFFPIVDDESMLQQTVRRLDGLTSVELPLIVCNEAHRFFAVDQLRAVGVSPWASSLSRRVATPLRPSPWLRCASSKWETAASTTL